MSALADVAFWRERLEEWWTAWPISGPIFGEFEPPDPSADPNAPAMYLEWGPEYDQEGVHEATYGGTVVRKGNLRHGFWYQRGDNNPDLEGLVTELSAIWKSSSTPQFFMRPGAGEFEFLESTIAPWSGCVWRVPFTIIEETGGGA